MKRLDSKALLPTRAHPDDAGLDLYALERVELAPGDGCLVRTGVAASFPKQTVGLILDRSSMAKRGLKTVGGVIDAGYRGEIRVMIRNLSLVSQVIEVHDRMAQLVLLPIVTPAPVEVDELDESKRGDAGFGSTGR